VCIGPENDTVDSGILHDAAKDSVRVFDLLVICGMAFDPHVYEEAKRYPNLTILLARMNADLSTGDELLNKTGAGNLFTVFGEPDIEIRTPNGNGKLEVEIKGLDIYDPTTGQIRSNSTDDIACWFIDTNYSGNSFIVRHTYFTGADKPYEKLKKTLKAEVDESARASLYSTVSRPFDTPEEGKIAVKVINHYGDEVLKVCDVRNGHH
jgi:adenine-specific DNA-methyltransferase